jgi:hypothetical protein
MSAIQADAPASTAAPSFFTEDGAAEELLRRFLPKDEDAAKPSSEKGEDKSAAPEASETPEASAEKPEAKEQPEAKGEEAEELDETETVFRIKIDGEEHEVPASKLTRLYGQEQSLTKKSMEVAEQRKQYDAKLEEQAAATTAILERARARWQPFSNLDFNLLVTQVASGELSTADYNSLRQSAQSAYEEVAFLEKHTADFVSRINENRTANLRQQAQEAIKVLSGPEDKGGLPGWSEKLYDDIRTFAVSQGAPADVVNSTVDPWTIRMWYSAMLYARGRDKSKVVVEKVNKTPKRIVKTTNSPAAEKRADGKSVKEVGAEKQFKSSKNADDAAELLLARWAKDSDD